MPIVRICVEPFTVPLRRRVQPVLRRTPYSVTGDLEVLIAALARHQAHHYQCAHATATKQIRALVREAYEEYRASSALYGDDGRGDVFRDNAAGVVGF